MSRYDRSEWLQGPCIFCGYNGQRYWHADTHAEYCLFHTVAGEDARWSRLLEVAKVKVDEMRERGIKLEGSE